MKTILCNRVYDTETATLVRKVAVGTFGDPAGYEESLYQTPEGLYFIYENGGADSVHPTKRIRRISEKKAKEWLAVQDD